MVERTRFEKELEFVQLLCNPEYLQYLYRNNYFSDEKFKNFVKYLQYWKNEPYRNFLLYPQCLEILDLLQISEFIKALGNDQTYVLLSEQQYNIWKNR